MILASMLLCACGGKKENVEETVAETTKTEPQVHRTKEYHLQDTIRMGNNLLVYTLHRTSDESQPLVKDEYGDSHVDNLYDLKIWKNGADFFSQRFTKSTFKSLLDADFQKYGILDGFRYSRSEDGKLLFSVCVSYPDSDMSAPFVVTIGPDGSYTLKKDDVLDVEELSDTEEV